MTSPLQYLLAVLAIFGLGTSQVLGLAGGYVCECSGEQVMASGPDCVSGGCHDQGDLDSNHDQDAPEAPHGHLKLTTVLLGHTFAPLVVALPPLTVCAALPGVNCALISVSVKSEPERPVVAPSGCGPPPPPGVLVARTMVMLV